jgi:hypothetical protein
METELWFDSLFVGRVSHLVAENGTCSGVIEFAITRSSRSPASDLLRFVNFCEDWNERVRKQLEPPSAAEFDAFDSIVKSGKWFTRSDGIVTAIDIAPVFFRRNEVSWRLVG